MPALAAPGPLVIIGGALVPDNESIYRAALDRRLPGKPICVLPIASGRPKRSMKHYVADFRRYGGSAAAVGVAITAARPRRAADLETAVRIENCGGFFFTGGDQSRIVDVLRPEGEPSAAEAAIRRVWNRGGVVAGTSAGAAMMSDPMIGGGSSSEAFGHGVAENEAALGVWVREGMGFLPRALVDQHCLARGRLGRLMVAMAEDDERRVGLCIDEDTAIVVEGQDTRVIGASGVAVIDLGTADRGEGGRGFRGGTLWLLGDGDRFDLESGRAIPDDAKQSWQPESSDSISTPAAPWARDAFHRFVIDFVRSTAGSAVLGSGPHRVRLRTGSGFRAHAREGGSHHSEGATAHPSALFAGPIEIDWLKSGNRHKRPGRRLGSAVRDPAPPPDDERSEESGGGGGNRTRVRKTQSGGFYVRILPFSVSP